MTRGCEWHHAPEACAEDFGRFEKSQLVEFWHPGRTVGFRGSPKPGQWPFGRSRTRWGWGADGTVSIERLCISPHVEKPFNSKVIKSFVPELRSRKCFSCFGIPMLYMNILWTLYVRFTYSCMGMLHNIIISYVISSHMGPIYIETHYILAHSCTSNRALFVIISI